MKALTLKVPDDFHSMLKHAAIDHKLDMRVIVIEGVSLYLRTYSGSRASQTVSRDAKAAGTKQKRSAK